MPRVDRPVLRYYGGKWMLAQWIIRHFGIHGVYVEPFCGAASVLMQKPRSRAEVINDASGDVVCLFRVLRDSEQAGALQEALRLTPFARDEYLAAFEPASDPVERARRVIVRSFFGRNGVATNANKRTGFRAHSHSSNTSAARDFVNYAEAIPTFRDRLRGVIIENIDALELIAQHDREDALIYADPPYTEDERASPDVYFREFTEEDHRRLALALHEAEAACAVSGYASPLYDEELYRDWHRFERDALADGAADRREVLWLNEKAFRAMPGQKLF